MDNRNNNLEPWEQDSYKTGSTQPPKKRSGLVAFLLVAVILLTGIASVLGAMNIRLFQILQSDRESFLSMLENRPTETSSQMWGTEPNTSGNPSLGLIADSINDLDRRYYHLPVGALVVEIEEMGCSAQAGLTAGDIILSFNGENIQSGEDLKQMLCNCKAGDRVELVFFRYRTGKQYRTTVILGAEKGE